VRGGQAVDALAITLLMAGLVAMEAGLIGR
jgi:hypothetical protein